MPPMASSRHRRPGFSRRAQYGLFAGYVVAVTGLVAGIGLILAARFDAQGFSAIRAIATDATAPVTHVGRDTIGGIASIGKGISAYIDAGSQNRALRAEIEATRARIVEARAIDWENKRLKRMLRLSEVAPTTVVVTRVVGSTVSSARRLATITAGRSSGVEPGQPVRSAEGLIGRVSEVGMSSAHVVLLTDSGNTVPVQIARSGVPAIATGRGDGGIDLRALIAGATPFHRGDVMLTSGTGGIYPPNIPVAVILSASGDSARAWPLADPAKLDFASVLRVFQPDLPPPPVAAIPSSR